MTDTSDSRRLEGFPQLIVTMTRAVEAMAEGFAIALSHAKRDTDSQKVATALKKHFQKIYPEPKYHSTGIDPHLTEDLHRTSRGHVGGKRIQNPRLVDLVLLHLREAMTQAAERHVTDDYILVPSPVFLAIEALTVPQEPHSRAYALVAARVFLSRRFSVWPRNSFVGRHPVGECLIDENDVIEQIGYCRTSVDYGDSWAIKADQRKKFIAQYLAARGVLLTRFTIPQAIDFLRAGPLTKEGSSSEKAVPSELQFRLSQKYVKLPPPADFMNEILGIPIAIRGTDNVFFNGLKPSVGAGLVMQVSGGPGAGKTTFALALAAALAPIGTQTLYFSFEEDKGDLVSKLRQIGQPRLAKLSFQRSKVDDWFVAFAVPNTGLDATQSKIIDPLHEKISSLREEWDALIKDGRSLPPLPFMIVLDSISALSLESQKHSTVGLGGADSISARHRLASFVEACRKIGALVVLITADRHPSWGDLDYLVDMVINLRVEGGEDHDKKPVRLLALSKSRHQISRHGTHIFHLSGDSGFRISPQLSSQMDAQQNSRRLLWDRDVFSEALNVRLSKDCHKYVEFIKIHWTSQILVQGRGSSGKAGLALRIALFPQYNSQGPISNQNPPRVLVVSFLYPQHYYDVLHLRLRSVIRGTSGRFVDADFAREYAEGLPKPEVIHLTPGSLHAEDLHSKLSRQLEFARLMGRPYTAVIIDGLHNLALQFPGAGDSNYLFPIIYGTLSRQNVTTITTFTTLSMSSSTVGVTADASEETEFRLRVHLPLLHTLVQASDYVFEVFRADSVGVRSSPDTRTASRVPQSSGAAYLIRVQSSISRDPPQELVGWQRQSLELCDPGWGYDPLQRTLF